MRGGPLEIASAQRRKRDEAPIIRRNPKGINKGE